MTVETVVASLTAFIALGLAYSAMRKDRSDVAGNLTGIALAMVNKLEDKVKSLEAKIIQMEAREKERDTREDELLAGVWILIRQLENAGIVPQWRPAQRPSEIQPVQRPAQKRRGF